MYVQINLVQNFAHSGCGEMQLVKYPPWFVSKQLLSAIS